MIPGIIEGADLPIGAPRDWDESQNGRCGALHVRTVQRGNLRFMESAWTPTPDELLALNAGASIVLAISAPQHPVVSVYVGPVPGFGELAELTHAKAGQTPNLERMMVWDEDRGLPVRAMVDEVDTREGWVSLVTTDLTGNPVLDDAGQPVTHRVQGNFSIRWRR